MRFFFAGSIIALAGIVPSFGFEPEALSTEVFFRAPEISGAQLSDDGARVVFLVPNEQRRQAIASFDLRTRKTTFLFNPNDYGIEFVLWKGHRILFGGEVGGNESAALRSINDDGTDLRDLSESYQQYRPVHGPSGGNIYSLLPHDPDHILIEGTGVSRDSQRAAVASGPWGFYLLNVKNGKRTLVEEVVERSVDYYVDGISGAIYGRTLQSGDKELIELKDTHGKYREVAQFPAADRGWSFVGLLPGGNEALLEVRTPAEHDRGALYTWDLRQMKRGARLYTPHSGEITQVQRDLETGRILGISYEQIKPESDWFDPVYGRIYADLNATFKDSTVHLLKASQDRSVFLIFISSDRDPGAYYIYQPAKPELTLLGRVNPAIKPEKMAARKPIRYAARDGLEIEGYLTEPRGREGQKNPLILLPHGGPFGLRDSWTFDREAQFLANRGYSVLQVNYRGSGGYGAKFQEAGKREWGRKMQDDLSDAVHWATSRELAEPDRVAIYGASYGGYAALAGLVFTPELYRCGVNLVGVSDLKLQTTPVENRGRAFRLFVDEWIGQDGDDLRARSPVNFVQNIRVPSLHAYGENDPRVDLENWRELEAKLIAHHKPYQFVLEKNEGHGFRDEQVRIKFYRVMEDFLAQNLRDSAK